VDPGVAYHPVMRSAMVGLMMAFVASGCGSDDAPPPPETGPVATYETGGGWLQLPFPHDVFRADDGTVDLPALPIDTPLWDDLRALLGERDGFCTTCAVHFPVEGTIDRASLGDDPAVGAAASLDDAVVMIDVERGDLVPLRREYSADDGLVSVRPARGVVLRPATTYAVALTTVVGDVEGAALRPSPSFEALRDGGGDSELAVIVSPGLDALEGAGLDRSKVASLAVFTTSDPVGHLAELHARLAEALSSEAPVSAVDQIWRADDGSLDTLLGVPAPGPPGMDAEPAMGTEGTRAVAHETVELLVAGSFSALRVVEGSGTEVGALRRDADGKLELGPVEDVPFLLTIPSGADLTRLPVAVVHWGIGGRRQNALVFADTLGQQGIAVLGIDAFQHGARAESAEDTAHDLRGGDGFLGPDGLDEHNTVGLSSRMFGISGVDESLSGSPRFALASLTQLAADAYSAVRFVKAGDWSALQAADASLAGLSFDPDRIYFIGESLGTIAATATLTADSGVSAAALGVAPGGLVDIFCEAPVYRTTAKLLFLPILGIKGDFDEIDRHLCMHPSLNLYRWALEPLEPQALARRIFLEPVAEGSRPDVLWEYGDRDESIGTAVPDALVAALGIPASGGFDFAAIAAGEPPFEANVQTPSGAVTAGAWRFEAAGHGMLGQIAQSYSHQPPILPPFETMPSVDFDNPTAQTHGLLAAFFAAHLAQGRARIAAP
jgi:hypothetical protein